MSSIATKQFHWISTPSFWQANQAQSARAQAFRANFESTNGAAADAFAGASANFATGMATIAAQRAAVRLNIPINGTTTSTTKVNTTA